jgi:UDP-glucose 4-epimerase
MKILIIGGEGYIGSHTVKMLGYHGCSVTTLNHLSNGHRDDVQCGDFMQGNFGDSTVLGTVL